MMTESANFRLRKRCRYSLEAVDCNSSWIQKG